MNTHVKAILESIMMQEHCNTKLQCGYKVKGKFFNDGFVILNCCESTLLKIGELAKGYNENIPKLEFFLSEENKGIVVRNIQEKNRQELIEF